ncbi:N-acetylglucosaminyl-diphospho-decaprenol L-rhamnosyltransferase [Botrimarina colliarenosi]|uniref:N-acetylglucosaminyl-diphospho-decaprenol L-rhamnosyltransferase n=1 Tax=Botrimarina colliarenosi TaxID=2528001 RepID=A0A5C6AC40_9BACT|nr:glycosyltransferase family 2 protein [Botrimarina colliarenosi]TWT97602.1 N-acetylglucosaminyl-diphospho-decaprenol L-rhamnosyltransferase [Botrimarina colliarenosi]
MRLLLVLVNYNGSGLTIDCLRSLAPELAKLPGVRVAVCDNGSEAGEVERLADAVVELGLSDRVDLRAVRCNQGFTGGNNVLIREALASSTPPDAVMLLNNDTLVCPGAIVELVRFLESHPDVGLCGSRLEHPDGESQRAARRFITAASEFEAYARIGVISRLLSSWLVAPPESGSSIPSRCGWIPGAALVVRTEVLRTVGLLDEGLYTYFDDVDYCFRARRAGWPTWYVPTSRIVHLVGKTTHITEAQTRPRRRPAYWFAARRRYFLTNFSAPYAAMADLAAIAGLVLHKTRVFVQRRPDPDPPMLLRDLARHSVLVTGFRRRPVDNPLTGAPVVSSAEQVTVC